MKIALIGYGRMGRMVEETALARGHEIVSVIDVGNPGEFDSPAFSSADVAVEFTSPGAAYGNCLRAFSRGLKVVSGSTGWMEAHGDEMRRLCAECGRTLFWASNFSVGVAVFSAVNRYLAGIMDGFPDYDVHVEETHHVHKADAPSGTAVTLADEIVGRLGRKASWTSGLANAPHDPSVLRVDSVRRGEVPGIHTVRYESASDSIAITHSAGSRRGFALGAVLAAEFTRTHSGFLTVGDMFAF